MIFDGKLVDDEAVTLRTRRWATSRTNGRKCAGASSIPGICNDSLKEPRCNGHISPSVDVLPTSVASMSLLDTTRLFDLFSGKSEERSFLDLVFTVNKLVWALVLVKWINFEVWWYCGGGSFAWNLCA